MTAVLALSDLAQLPSVRSLRLSFDKVTAVRLFGEGASLKHDPTNIDMAYRVNALVLAAPRISELLLRNFIGTEAIDLVRTFPNLRILGLVNFHTPEQINHLSEIIGAIACLRGLASLTISLDVDTELEWPHEALAPLERDPPPVKHLQLINFKLDQHLISFISTLDSTLETVTLREAFEVSDPSELSSAPPLQLPLLVNLHLDLQDMASLSDRDLSRILLSSSTLATLSLTTRKAATMDAAAPSLTTFLSSQPKLRQLFFGEHLPVYPIDETHILPSPSSLAAFANIVHSRGLNPAILDRPHLSPFHKEAKLDYTENKAGYLKEVLGRTLEFGKMELERMFAVEGNGARAVGWVAKLKALEEERLAWKE